MIAQVSFFFFFFKICILFSDLLGCQQGASKPTVGCSHANVFQMDGNIDLVDAVLKKTPLDTFSLMRK